MTSLMSSLGRFDWNEFKDGKIAVRAKSFDEAKLFVGECGYHGVPMPATSHPTYTTLIHAWFSSGSQSAYYVSDSGLTCGKVGYLPLKIENVFNARG